MTDTLLQCCERWYSWTVQECMGDYVGTGKYYVDWESYECVKDCAEDGSDADCGGFAYRWDLPLYNTKEECRKTALSWKTFEYSENNDVSSIDNDEYYVYWNHGGFGNHKCVKNCVVSATAPECGGLAKTWDVKFKSADACCSQLLSYVPREDCTTVQAVSAQQSVCTFFHL